MNGLKTLPLRATVDGDRIVIEIGIDTLAFCAAHHPDYWDGESDDTVPNIPVIDAAAFAREVCRELNDESETGITLLTRILDEAMDRAVSNGCEGIAEDFWL